MQNRHRRIALNAAHNVDFRICSARIPFLKFLQVLPPAPIQHLKKFLCALAILLAQHCVRKQRNRVPTEFLPAHGTYPQFAHQSLYCVIATGTKSTRRLFNRMADRALHRVEKTHCSFSSRTSLWSPTFLFVRTVASICPRASRTAISSPSTTCSTDRKTRPFASYAIAYPRSSN